MSLILNIDTTSTIATVSIANNEKILTEASNTDLKSHAAFLQPAIENCLKKISLKIQDLDAIAVNHGPGSYTGIRVGLASAKGICYALNKPLILLNALELLCAEAMEIYSECVVLQYLFCPMIDARRLEIFSAVYDADLKKRLDPCAYILPGNLFPELLITEKILFFGDGSHKWQALNTNTNARFETVNLSATAISKMSFNKFMKKEFSDIMLAEPMYIKEFNTTQSSTNQ